MQRHICVLDRAASGRRVKERVFEGKTPGMTVEQANLTFAGKN